MMFTRERKYERLKREYEILKRKYNTVKNNPEKIKHFASYRIKKHILDLFLFMIVSWGLWYYRNPIIIIIGLMTSIIDFKWELYCVRRGLWTYQDSKHLTKDNIPMNIPITYFLIGAAGAVYVLFRLGIL
ncbi:MAG: hypothetical protein PHU12_03715 [Candidatus Aenigmarchaeota archaeon]|nr:hypothetical protein [Candidatus Aenigmarchaeota archaeon]